MTRGIYCSKKFLILLVLLPLSIVSLIAVDLKEAVVVIPSDLSAPEKKAVLMLIEEVEKRTHIRWPQQTAWPSSNSPVIAVGPKSALEHFAGPFRQELQALPEIPGAEGYRLCVKQAQGNSAVFVIGNDARGV